MEHEKGTYFGENEYDDVKGFTIIAAKDDEYHIAEKWLKEDSEDQWLDYWVPADQLHERHEEGLCDKKGKLTQEQFEAVCEKVGWTDYAEEKVEA